MPFIPHTEQEIQDMLTTIGVNNVEALFSEIPPALRQTSLTEIPSGISEMDLAAQMRKRALLDDQMLCFIGAGAYEHHIPAVVWDIATRGEFMTAYTPYQAEASQGSLQLIYEYQSMMAKLLSMEVSNASLYDGATALAESILMSVRLESKKNKNIILMPQAVHPFYRQTVQTIVEKQDIKLLDIPFIKATGQIDEQALKGIALNEVAAIVIPQPNFFGVLEAVDQLTDWASNNHILSIALVNPLAMALLKPPGQWGKKGADIACGDGQPLGVPLASGGPYYGFLCCKKSHIRQMPGRIVGQTTDQEGKQGFVLTLQAREQHIRRGKATSNICTNQGLIVTASTIYMSLMGPQGLRRVALAAHAKARTLNKALLAIPGVQPVFNAPFFHEVVIRLPAPVGEVLHQLSLQKIQGGYALQSTYPELGESLLICATETKTDADIALLAANIAAQVKGDKIACLA